VKIGYLALIYKKYKEKGDRERNGKKAKIKSIFDVSKIFFLNDS